MNELANRINSAFDEVMRMPAERVDRAVGFSLAVPAWLVLGIARWLEPSPLGFGTHTQLGLGGCTMLTFTGWPCPMCGMTTTFSLLAHGRVVEAFVNQPFGPVLFALTVAAALLGTVDLVGAPGAIRKAMAVVQRREQLYAILLLVGLFLGWVYKAVLMHPEAFALSS